MDELIQVLLFILTIVIFVVSGLRKQKKKPNASPTPTDELLESLFGIPTPKPEIIEEKEIIIEPLKEPIKEVKQKPFKPLLPEEGIAAVSNKYGSNVSNVEEEKELEKTVPVLDLRTAVIYSEILNRKIY